MLLLSIGSLVGSGSSLGGGARVLSGGRLGASLRSYLLTLCIQGYTFIATVSSYGVRDLRYGECEVEEAKVQEGGGGPIEFIEAEPTHDCIRCGTPVLWNDDEDWWEHTEECPEDSLCWAGEGVGPYVHGFWWTERRTSLTRKGETWKLEDGWNKKSEAEEAAAFYSRTHVGPCRVVFLLPKPKVWTIWEGSYFHKLAADTEEHAIERAMPGYHEVNA